MIGNNEITLNQATMISALQYYFNEVLFQAKGVQKVTSIKGSPMGDTFEVKVESSAP